jgi:hypothetical protein
MFHVKHSQACGLLVVPGCRLEKSQIPPQDGLRLARFARNNQASSRPAVLALPFWFALRIGHDANVVSRCFT